MAYAAAGRPADAAEAARAGIRLSGGNGNSDAFSVIAAALVGDIGEAREGLRELIESRARRYVRSTWIASIYTILGDYEKAFEWLEQAYEERAPLMPGHLKIASWFEPLRKDSRYAAMLARCGLEPV